MLSFGIDTFFLTILLAALVVAPGIAIAIYIYWKDKFEREPRMLLLRSFFIGMLGIIPPVIVHLCCDYLNFDARANIASTALYAFVIVALSEELSKYILLRWYAYPKHDFNEPFDGITYSVMVAMGFATIENIFYVLDSNVYKGMEVALLRMFTAVPSHAADAILMGYFMGLAKFRHDSQALQITAVMVAVIAHGSYDFFLFIENIGFVEKIGLIATGALLVLAAAVYFSMKAIKIHQMNSPFRKRAEEEQPQL